MRFKTFWPLLMKDCMVWGFVWGGGGRIFFVFWYPSELAKVFVLSVLKPGRGTQLPSQAPRSPCCS